MEKKDGFTLIELLAVIVILGVIITIAVFSVREVIYQSKKKAFEATINNVVSAAKAECELGSLNDEGSLETYTFTNGTVSPSLEVEGELPTSGVATVDGDCNVALNVTNGEFTATKTVVSDEIALDAGSESEVTPTYSVYPNGTAIYFNPVTGVTCTAGEAVSTTGTKTGCMKWYTFNDGGSSSESINLLLNHNTSAKVAWNATGSNLTGPANVFAQLQSDTNSWVGVPTRTDSYSLSNGTTSYLVSYGFYKARLITAAEFATITNNLSFDEKTATNANAFIAVAWLFDNTNGCTSYGCNSADSATDGYWTSTAQASSTNLAWRIRYEGAVYASGVDINYYYGVRPVITVLKSSL